MGDLDAVVGEAHQGGTALSLSGRHEVGRRVRIEANVATLTRKDDLLPASAFGDTVPSYIDELTGRIEGATGG